MIRLVLIPLALFLFTVKPIPQHKEPRVIMAVFAHPDDEITLSPLLAKYARMGDKVYLVIATKGEKGTQPHAGIAEGYPLAKARKKEAECACSTLGINPPILLGLNDGELDEDFTAAPLHAKIDSVLKLYQPDILLTWGPDGGYGHMDHRLVHDVVTELFQANEQAKPSALYYTGVLQEILKNLPPLKTASGMFLQKGWLPVKEKYLTVRIPISDEDLHQGEKAMRCHASQYSPAEMDEVITWMRLSKDTVYLRPFLPVVHVQHRLY
jgi:LmbE family N-acetylglucosaminyl deacetylase